MKHKWLKQPDIEHIGMPKHLVWLCKVCGCKKVQGNYRFAQATYWRSSIHYDYYIECYDEAAEKLKTID